MNHDLMRARPQCMALLAGVLMLAALSIAAALGLPDNPKDPPPPPSSAGNLFGNETIVRFNDNEDESNAAEGKPEISGVPEENGTVTALKGTIMDPQGTDRADNGETGHAYRYQWVRIDGDTETDIANATLVSYDISRDDVGKRIKVKVWFADDAGNDEGPLSSDSVLVLGQLLVSNMSPPANKYRGGSRDDAGQAFVTGSERNYVITSIGIRSYSSAIGPPGSIGLVTLNATNPNTGLVGDILVRMKSPEEWNSNRRPNYSWRDVDYFTAPTQKILLKPNTKYWVVVNVGSEYWDKLHLLLTVHPGRDAESRRGWRVPYNSYAYPREGTWYMTGFSPGHGFNVMFDVRGTTAPPGLTDSSDATGAPTISGLAAESNWLRLSTSGIADANGKTFADLNVRGHEFTYQWVRVDGDNETDIAGATNIDYQISADDVGKTIKVKVWFTDDQDYAEGPLTSAAFPATGTIQARPAQVLVENTTSPNSYTIGGIWAQRFRTGRNVSGYDLHNVVLRTGHHSMGLGVSREDAPDTVVRIYTNGSGSLPGTELYALTTGTVTPHSYATFVAPEGATLSPRTNYWVVVTDRAGVSEPATDSGLTVGTGQNSDLADGWSIDNRTYGKNHMNNNWRYYPNNVLQIRLLGQPVP